VNALFQDIRYALRQLRKSPAFTLTAVLTLALGIGANSAVFTLFDQVLLRMLPVEQPKELVRFVWSGSFSGSTSSFGGDASDFFSYPMYKDLSQQNQVFQGILAADRTYVGVNWQNQAEDKDAELVTGNYFQLLGLKPTVGRLFTPQDETVKNANPVAVLSYDYWKSRFAASPSVVGQVLLVNGQPFTILGVAPENFQTAIGGYTPGVFLPMTMSEVAMPWTATRDNLHNHQSIWLTLVARLKPGVTRQQAQASLAPLWHSLRAYELTLYTGRSERFKQNFVDNSHLQVLDDSTGFNPARIDLKTPLIILMSMATLLVAICAINVATLLLLRAAGRAREMAMRYALGAKRARIVSQLLVEGALLGISGAAAGIVFAPVVTRILIRLLMNSGPTEAQTYSTAIDARILLFTLAVSVIASLLFSIAPVLHFLRPDVTQALHENAGTAGKGSQRFRKLAVGAQIALSVLLLGGAGLFVRTLDNLRHQSPGFVTENLDTFMLDPTQSGYGNVRSARIMTDALDALRRIPGVIAAGGTEDPELVGKSTGSNFTIQGYKPAEDENTRQETPWITPGYFAALRQPILLGREFTASDVQGQPKVAVVNQAFAIRYFGSVHNAIGRMLAQGSGPETKLDTTIVGVVGNIKHQNLRTDMGPAVYRPYMQEDHPRGLQLYVRTTQSPELAVSSIRDVIHQLDPTLVVNGLRTMEDQIDISTSDNRALAFLAIGFSILAMILAAVGFYGVLAYSTEQRTREIGVRLALGAQRWGVIVLVVREMAMIAAGATAIALPSIVILARYFSSQLYGVAAFDPLTLAGAVLLTAIMVVLAAIVPARRAASIEPMQALRTE
jgi:putative ABC transport system permease protein